MAGHSPRFLPLFFLGPDARDARHTTFGTLPESPWDCCLVAFLLTYIDPVRP